MPKAILGRKVGMTQIFDETGRVIPVTVVEAGPCSVVQVRTEAQDGYRAVQLGFGQVRRGAKKPAEGHAKKAGVPVPAFLREFRLVEGEDPAMGSQVRVEIFVDGEMVDVTGTSRGKGFAGSIKRWGFGRGPMTHGSKYHRGPGSLAPRRSGGGGKVHKGRKLPGRMGGERVTVQNLQVVRVDGERNLLLVKGAVPGPRGGYVSIRAAVKGRGAR